METKTVKEIIIDFLRSTKRPYIDDLIEHMEEIGFFDAPASGGNHLHCPGGLAEHSLNVCHYALQLAESFLANESYEAMYESIIIASLLHDLGKCGDHGKKMYVDNVLKSGNVSEAKPYKRNPDLLSIDHATRSLMIANRFIDLTEDEEFAIRYHDGLYESANYDVKGNETPLYIIIHTADLWCSHIIEKGEN